MPIYKRCSLCNKRLPSGTKCDCNKKRYKEEDKYKKDTKEKQFYSSEEWNIMREKAKNKYKGIDVYSYYVLGIVEYGQTVHHIKPLKENWDIRLDINNLIYLTESNHRKLHHRMEHGEKEEVIKELYDLIDKFEKEMIN